MNKEFQGFSLGTQNNSSLFAGEEGVHYVVYKNSKGVSEKLLNIDHEMYAPKQGIVQIEPLKIAKARNPGGGFRQTLRHLNIVQMSVVRDKKTGYLIGIPLGWSKDDKSINWKTIRIEGELSFDLSIPSQRAEWIIVKNSQFLEGSPNFLASSKTIYRAVDVEKEATDFQLLRKTKRKAVEIADSLVGKDLEDVALMLNFDPKAYTPASLSMAIIKFAEDSNKRDGKTGAERFMEVWNSDTRAELAILRRAMNMGVVTTTMDAGINYNALTLGFNEAEAVGYLKTHPQTSTSIDLATKSRDAAGNQAMGIKEVNPNAEIERLKEELAKKEREAEELKASLEKKVDEDPELTELINEAKSFTGKYAIKGVHNMKDKDKIREKIAEAKALQEADN